MGSTLQIFSQWSAVIGFITYSANVYIYIETEIIATDKKHVCGALNKLYKSSSRRRRRIMSGRSMLVLNGLDQVRPGWMAIGDMGDERWMVLIMIGHGQVDVDVGH